MKFKNMVDQQKICPRCRNTFPLTIFQSQSGRSKTYCPECTKAYKRESYAKNPTKSRENAKRWALGNAEKYSENQKQYRLLNRGLLNEKAKVYREKNATVIREKDRLRQRNPEDVKRYIRNRKEKLAANSELYIAAKEKQRKAIQKWNAINKTVLSNRNKMWREANLDLARARGRKSVSLWRQRHPEQHHVIQKNRRALKLGAKQEGFDGIVHESHLLEWQQGRCFHCNGPLNNDKSWDHFVPVTKGGPHNAENIVLCCRRCNSSKGNRIYGVEWFANVVTQTDYVLRDECFKKLTEGNDRFALVSTFMLSERNCGKPTETIGFLKNKHEFLIFDYEWKNRKSAIVGFVKNRLGKSQSVGARSTTLVEVDVNSARNFFNETHLQGFGSGSLYLGLVYEDQLIGCSSWKKHGQVIELNRMSFKGRIVGGFSKMLNGLLGHESYAGQAIFSFVDPRYADGHSYETVGFKYAGETSSPVYYYVNGCGIYHRRNFTRGNLQKFLPWFDSSLTEQENARANGYFRLQGLKQKRFIYL